MILRAVLGTLALPLVLAACAGEGATGDSGPPAGRSQMRHIMPWPAGSGSDIAMRGFLAHLEQHLGARIHTENIAGGLSARGIFRTRMAAPDGLTIGTMTYDVLTVEFFDLVPVTWRDFDILGTITEHPTALIARSDRWSDVHAFRRDAAAASPRLKLGNAGSGGVFHQHAVAMEEELSVRFNHVPYASSSGQLASVLGREVDAIVASLPVVLPYVREGSLRVLGVMARGRQPILPEAPTFVEEGFDVVFSSFRMLVIPRGVEEAERARLETAVQDAWHDPAFQRWAERAAIGASWKDPGESRAFIEELEPRVLRLMQRMME